MEEFFDFLGTSAGWIIGIGVTLGVAATVSETGRPLAKRAIKGYLSLADRAKVTAAEVGEQMEDLVAEARMEYDQAKVSANGVSAESAAPSIIVPARKRP